MKNNQPILFHIYRDRFGRVVKRAKFKFSNKIYKVFYDGRVTYIKYNKETIAKLNKDIYEVFDNFEKEIKK